jgi:PEP-CTERM motif
MMIAKSRSCVGMTACAKGTLVAAVAVAGLVGIQSQADAALVARYTFDEASGDALDTGTVAPPANGVFEALATRSADTPSGTGSSLDLSADGLTSFVNMGDPAKVDTLSQFTMSTWLKLSDLNANNGGSGNVRLLAKQEGTFFDGFSWNLNNPNVGVRGIDDFRMAMFIGGVTAFDFGFSIGAVGSEGDGDVDATDWVFLAVTYDGTATTDNLKFYSGSNANAVTQLGVTQTANAGAVRTTAGFANFGPGFTDAAPAADFAAEGLQDDIRVYDNVLDLAALEAVRAENAGAPGITGDLDSDGFVGIADLNIVLGAWNQNVPPGNPLADPSGDGFVGIDDLNTVLGNWNAGTPPPGASAVPEPASLALLGLGGLAMLKRRR